jgi:hypothetical protein
MTLNGLVSHFEFRAIGDIETSSTNYGMDVESRGHVAFLTFPRRPVLPPFWPFETRQGTRFTLNRMISI